MDTTIKKWKAFLAEEQQFPYEIYCDMDGVLVNFEDGVIKYINSKLEIVGDGNKYKRKLHAALEQLGREHKITITDISYDKSKRLNVARSYMYRLVQNNEEFWADLDWMPDGKKLWNSIKHLNPTIITAPMAKGSEEGKIEWVKKNLGLDKSRIILTSEKYMHARPNRLLIDDFIKYVEPWIDAKGKAIHHQSAQETINKLEELAK